MVSTENKYYLRLNYFHRITHAFVIISFLGLVITGIPLKYCESKWATLLAYYLGGFRAAGMLHRLCAIITFGYFLGHIIFLIYYFFRINKDPFLKFIIGPNSMVPNLKDAKDIAGNFKWFLGMGPKPKFDRFTYWEKFDYWAVFWGVAMIGGSGLMLWFPVFFSKFMPGWALNIAAIIHSDEALLATGFIFTFHYIHAHLRGDKFPMDPVIFTGKITLEELKHERPLEYERMVQDGTLKDIETFEPPLWLKNTSLIVGLTSLVIGIAVVVLIVLAHMEA